MSPGLDKAQASSLIWQNPKSTLRQTPNARRWVLLVGEGFGNRPWRPFVCLHLVFLFDAHPPFRPCGLGQGADFAKRSALRHPAQARVASLKHRSVNE
jgi:hypothetical protein